MNKIKFYNLKMSKFATFTFIAILVLFSQVQSSMLESTLTQQTPDEICPSVNYRPKSFTDDLIKIMKQTPHEERLEVLRNELDKDVLLINSLDIVRLTTEVLFRKELKSILNLLNNYILRLSPNELVDIVKVQKRKFQADAVVELSDTLSDVSDETKDRLVDAVYCKGLKKVARDALEGIEKRSCITGKLGDNLVFLIDLSASMNYVFKYKGNKYSRLNFLKPVIINAIKGLDKTKRIKIVTFATHAEAWKNEFIYATKENKAKAIEFVRGLQAKGFTNTKQALEKSFGGETFEYSLVLFTDGMPTRGETKPAKLLNYVKNINLLRKTQKLMPIRIHMNVVMLGGYESVREKEVTKKLTKDLAQISGGTYKDFTE
jgi:Mg-chelatase subunit ChlD